MKQYLTPYWLLWLMFLLVMIVITDTSGFTAEKNRCDTPLGHLVSRQGIVRLRDAGEETWREIKMGSPFCPGDNLEVSQNSRAVVQLSNHSFVNLASQSVLSFSAPEEKEGFWISILKGIGHFISRVPRQLNISTPFINALVEGTEFVIRLEDDAAFFTVFEGTVYAQNKAGELRLHSGQSGIARAQEAPVSMRVLRPRDAVQWALYYPAILQFDEKTLSKFPKDAWQSRWAKSIRFFKQGNITNAFDAISEIDPARDDPDFLIFRASLYLSVGQVENARSDLQQALKQRPGDGNALAVKALLAVTQNDQEAAVDFAEQAVQASPKSDAPYMARSYVRQATFQLNLAQEDVETVVAQSPQNALAWARLAELRLMFRDLDDALATADKAVALDPDLSKTQSVLGFAHLIRIEIDSAKTVFKKAVEMDASAPMPRLGLGLTLIREGELEAGRREIEIAAMLNPSHALIRSYLGKAYYEEKRDALAEEQYEMAAELDPLDPTPYLYRAILNQTNNRPVEALKDIEKSIEQNDNRAVYRSRFLLDEDLATRSVSHGRIYQDLGFQERALAAGWYSVVLDPGNYSGHRLLADSYASLPRHEIARVSELLQSQLLQPLNMTALRPQLAETNLTILQGAGPSDLSFNEFNPLFVRNRTGVQANTVTGSNKTIGDDLVLSTIQDKISFSLGQFYYETDGYRANNDLKQEIYNVFGQGALSFRSNLQFEVRRNRQVSGDLRQRFDLLNFSDNRREERDEDSLRVGYHYAPSPKSDWLFSGVYRKLEGSQIDSETLSPVGPGGPVVANNRLTEEFKGYNGELRYQERRHSFKYVVGAGYSEDKQRSHPFAQVSSGPIILAPSNLPAVIGTNKYANSYIYLDFPLHEQLTLTWGLSLELVDSVVSPKSFDQVNPKMGILWRLNPETTLRLAGFRTLKRTLVSNQTIEPTQVSGINQFFDDPNGTDSKNYGLGWDQKFGSDFSAGITLIFRDMEVPFVSSGGVRFEKQEEQLYLAYFNWTPTKSMVFTAEYRYEKFERERDRTGVNLPAELTTQRIPLSFRYFYKMAFFKLKTRYIQQDIVLSQVGVGNFLHDDDQFWVTDVELGYRIPKRQGIVLFSVQNLFDKNFKFYEDDFRDGTAKAPTIIPERTFYLKIQIALN